MRTRPNSPKWLPLSILCLLSAMLLPIAAGATTCASIAGKIDHEDFQSCVADGVADLGSVAIIADNLFMHDQVSVDAAIPYKLFDGRLENDNDAGLVYFHRLDKRAATFFAVPNRTLFVSLQVGPSYELFRTPSTVGLLRPFTVRHGIDANAKPRATFFLGEISERDAVSDRGDMPETTAAPVPLPPTFWLLLAAISGFVYLSRARRA